MHRVRRVNQHSLISLNTLYLANHHILAADSMGLVAVDWAQLALKKNKF